MPGAKVASYSWLVTRTTIPPSRGAPPPPGIHPRKLCLRGARCGAVGIGAFLLRDWLKKAHIFLSYLY